MAEFYYIDLYFGHEHRFCDLVLECVSSLMGAGCELRKVVVPTMNSPTAAPGKGVSHHYSLQLMHSLCGEHFNRSYARKEPFISFPPAGGRIVLSHDFQVDMELVDDARDEEAETRTWSNEIGLLFRYTADERLGRKIKLTMSLWYDYILSHGRPETHAGNAAALIRLVGHMSESCAPYFGVMNTELHIDIDSALERLRQGKPPSGNDFAFVGPTEAQRLDLKAVSAMGAQYRIFPTGFVAIQFTNRWDGQSALEA